MDPYSCDLLEIIFLVFDKEHVTLSQVKWLTTEDHFLATSKLILYPAVHFTSIVGSIKICCKAKNISFIDCKGFRCFSTRTDIIFKYVNIQRGLCNKRLSNQCDENKCYLLQGLKMKMPEIWFQNNALLLFIWKKSCFKWRKFSQFCLSKFNTWS